MIWIIALPVQDKYHGTSGDSVDLKDACRFTSEEYAEQIASFLPGSRVVEIPDDLFVHVTHCCGVHGCKYGHEDCPVETHKFPQAYKCESCFYYEEEASDSQVQVFELQKQLAELRLRMNEGNINPDFDIKQTGHAWVVYERRRDGAEVFPVMACKIEATATSIANGSLAFSSANVVREPVFSVNGKLYGPISLLEPSEEDLQVQKMNEARALVIAKAHMAGLTDEDIAILASIQK